MSSDHWISRRIVGFTQIIAIGAILGSLAARLGQHHFFFDLCTHFRTQAIAGLLICGTILLFFKGNRLFGGFSMLIGIVLLISLLPYYIGKATPSDTSTSRVLSFNVLTSNSSKDRVGEYILSEDPDIVILMEVNQRWAQEMEETLSDRYPFSIIQARSDNFGILAFCKKEPISSAIIYPGYDQLPSVDLRFQNVRILGTHPLPPMSNQTWLSRNKQIEELGKEIRGSKLPTIVCGDFNSGPWSPFMKEFLAQSELTNSAKGYGLKPTWYPFGSLIGLSIDHVFHTKELKVNHHKVGPNLGSDHRPVVVDYQGEF